jgi:pyruvate/2-oxoglutarate dehydrogenase complex dihydrolipoamide acyltransferase (E2) component
VSTATPIVLERANVNDETVTLLRWFVKDGDRVEADVLLAEVETSKANLEIHSERAGYVQWAVPEGAEVAVSSAIGYIADAPGAGPAITAAVKPAGVPAAAPAAAIAAVEVKAGQPSFESAAQHPQRFSKLAEAMMQAHGLTAADFPGKTLVRKQDVLERLNGTAPEKAAPQTTAPAVPSAARITQPFREIPLSKMKRSEGATLAAGSRTAVTSAVSVTCFTRGLRKALKTHPVETGNLSAVIVYEVGRLLPKYPTLNAAYRAGVMLQYEQVNVGFALDDGRGLKVAVFQNCDRMGLEAVADELFALTAAYIADKLTPAQISNATFTISDLSGFGVSDAYPVISENQGAILAVSGEQFAPGAAYGFYTLTLAFDHQLSDGRTAARFLNDLKKRLQHYEDAVAAAVAAG